jgi:hypothetical protein
MKYTVVIESEEWEKIVHALRMADDAVNNDWQRVIKDTKSVRKDDILREMHFLSEALKEIKQ